MLLKFNVVWCTS